MTFELDFIQQLVSDDFNQVNALMLSNLDNDIPLIEQLGQYLIQSGGKRLRPLVLLLCAKACNYKGSLHINLAASIEYFHTATLLHDDVVDESNLRRGKKTAHHIWGSKASILVGDYLFTQSVQWIMATKNWGILDVFAYIANQISRGEIKQLSQKNQNNTTLDDYFDIIHSKTALLFSAAAELAGRLATKDTSIHLNLQKYGLHLGNAFQMMDDILDYSGNVEHLGKNIGDDLNEGKMTLPLFIALLHATEPQANVIKTSITEGGLSNLNDILNIIEKTNAIAHATELAKAEIQKAINMLDFLPSSQYKDALISLAHFAITREQ